MHPAAGRGHRLRPRVRRSQHDGEVRVERGFIRPEDHNRQQNLAKSGLQDDDEDGIGDDDIEPDTGFADSLVADLTSHRTLGLPGVV